MNTSFLTPRQERVQHIHELLAKGRPVTCGQVARELETSERTIQRDLDYMREELLLPIEYESGLRTFVYVAPASLTLFGQGTPRQAATTFDEAVALPLEDKSAGHLTVICSRYGVRANDVLRAIVGSALANAVCDSALMTTIVRAARVLATDGREIA